MRIRHRPWAQPELDASPFFINDPVQYKGRWASAFPHKGPLHLELGCGKGSFIAQMGLLHPELNFLAVDIKSDMLGLAKRKIEQAYGEQGREVDNIRLFARDIERILLVMDEQDLVERIYINFCNPWPRPKCHKKRLTHPRQLENYKSFLQPSGEIWFKTDDPGLFRSSLSYFEDCGFDLLYVTEDLHNSGFTQSLPTEHEIMFSSQGLPIHFLRAKLAKKACSTPEAPSID